MIPNIISDIFNKFAPTRNVLTLKKPWEGSIEKKPWHYKVTAVIPVMDTFEQLNICIQLLKEQSLKPFIVIVDTGSNEEEYKKICGLRNDDVEVHSLKFNGVLHPSDFPAIAMDLAFSCCRTEYLFATHSDVFLRKKTFLNEMIDLCKTKSPVVGYEISPRAHEDWKGMVSHTATMYHIPTMDIIGFGWSLRRLCNIFNIKDPIPDPRRPCWPDTELLGNYILRSHKIEPHLIGKEENFKRTLDDNIDHFRSFTSGKLYSRSYYKICDKWYEDAKKEALERIEEWKKENNMKIYLKSKELNG